MPVDQPSGRRCAVVYNPIKVSDDLRNAIKQQATAAGWNDSIWLATPAEDPGPAITAEVVSANVDRVIAAGGDGTIRIVADRLAGSGIPMAVVPVGTGNLLARNLEIPLTETEALAVAFGQHTKEIDLVKLTVDGVPGEHFAVIAGLGVDAMIMEETNPDLKDSIGAGAYFIAAAKALGRTPIHMWITLDDQRPQHRYAMICAIGNVGTLAGKLTLLPGARPDDGRLDVYVASPRRLIHWLRVLLRLITLRPRRDDRVDQWRAQHVDVRLKHPDPYQLDGDVIGDCRSLRADIAPKALTVCVPG
ncbi:MAG TPA: diacylglycerol kinase family protein [Propionibacteriaceae bacterium]|nr:diacylglycerol kinase family protein [Propionibacteriaceae bacterium]